MVSVREREFAISLIEELLGYGLVDHLSHSGEHCTETWFKTSELRSKGFWAANGISKVCFGHEELDNWVIKVGYTEDVSRDYAAQEYKNYCRAKEAGLEYYFAETVYIGEFGGRAFYLQERAECSEYQISCEWYERLRDEYGESGEEYDDCDLWDMIYDMDDDERAYLTFKNRELCDFLMENGIGDLHEGNFGYVGDHAVIVDFSGWLG